MPDGSVKHLRVVGHPSTEESGSFEFVGAVTDITERKRAEEELHQKEASLREAQTELAHVSRVTTLGELAASIAHEVNQPLAGIATNASASLRWLAGELPNLDEAREAIRRIIRDGNRAGDVVSRMRALFKKACTAMEWLDINDAIEEVVILTQSEVRRNKVALRMELAADLPPVMGDRVQLQQVVVNLILNAIEAMSTVEDRERDLVIRTQRGEGDEVRVAVQDSVSALIQTTSNEFLMLSILPNPTAWAWGYQSVVLLLNVTADGSGPYRTTVPAQPFDLPCVVELPELRFNLTKLRNLDPPRARPRPRRRSRSDRRFLRAKESPIVPQLFCPVSLIVKHRDSRGRRTTTSIQESRGFFGCDMNT